MVLDVAEIQQSLKSQACFEATGAVHQPRASTCLSLRAFLAAV